MKIGAKIVVPLSEQFVTEGLRAEAELPTGDSVYPLTDADILYARAQSQYDRAIVVADAGPPEPTSLNGRENFDAFCAERLTALDGLISTLTGHIISRDAAELIAQAEKLLENDQ